MTQIFRTVLSMSLSGTLLILALLLGGRLLKGKLGRQWQYYIWLIVVLRLFLPFGPEASLMGQVHRVADRAVVQMEQESQNSMQNGQQFTVGEQDEPVSGGGGEYIPADSQGTTIRDEDTKTAWENGSPFLKALALVEKYFWVIWLAVALAMLTRRISMYRSYIRYVTAGTELVCDVSLLDRLAIIQKQAGIGRTLELGVNPQVSSPMLVGYFHPCIILPDLTVAEKDFPYIIMHELTHYKRRDIWYKWLVQLVVCIHWFNPFVHVMSREIDKACEFACDEAVVRKMGYDHARDYGKTLLDAMTQAGTCREPIAAVTMSANKELLRERLGAIMNCGKKTKRAGTIATVLTVGIVLGTVFIGVYPTAAAEPDPIVHADKTGVSEVDGIKAPALSAPGKTLEDDKEASAAEIEEYYKNRSLPLFYIAFDELDEKAQETWLDRIYADRNLQFFSAGVQRLDAGSPLIQSFAQRFYEEDDVAFFSVLADEIMSEEMLERWLDQAIADQKWTFQSMLYDELGRDEEKDALDKEWEKKQAEEYRAVGVSREGKSYYYKGELVYIFLDRNLPNQSFFTLDMNPAGTVNIKIIRSADGQITGVTYMTEAEVGELLGDMYEDEEEDNEADEQENEIFPREMTVNMPVCRIRAGAGEAFPVVNLVGEGERVTVLGKSEGSDGRLWYLLDQESLSEEPEPSVEECYIRGDLLE